MSDYGIIYVVKNSHYGKDIFKVGKSSRTLDERIKELSGDTGVLGRFEGCAIFVVKDIHTAEYKCHNALDKFRLQSNREFFQINYAKLINIIRNQIQEFYIEETIFVDVDKKDEELLSAEIEQNQIKIEKEKKKKQEEIEGKNLNLETVFNHSSSVKEKVIEEKKIESEKLSIKIEARVQKFKPIFDSKIEELKQLVNDIPYINFYRYPPAPHNRVNEYGYVVILSKKNSTKLQESIDYNNNFDELVELYLEDLPIPNRLEHLAKNQRGADNTLTRSSNNKWQLYPPERKRIGYDETNSEDNYTYQMSDDIICFSIVFDSYIGVIKSFEYNEEIHPFTKEKKWTKSMFLREHNIENFGNFFTQLTKKLAEFQAEQNNLESSYTSINFNDFKDPK